MRTVALLVAIVIGLAACNTMAGLGKDIERTGEKIQDKAKK
jgi:predicted small secreted protein